MTTTELYILLEGFAIAFFGIMGVQNLSHRDERLRMILGGILIYWMFQYVSTVFYAQNIIYEYRQWSRLVNVIDMTAEPTCCFLLLELCRPGWLNWRRAILNVVPFIGFGAVYCITGFDLVYYLFLGFFVAYGIGVFVAIIYYIPRYNNFLREHYSYEENVNLIWLYYVLLTFFALMFVYAICATYDTVIGDCIYMGGSVISWGVICYFISRQESVLYELKLSEREAEEMGGSETHLTEGVVEESNSLERNIQELFIKPQIYLRPQLKLGDMAEIVRTNRTYLSRYLNEKLHTTFYDYINGLRLQHAVTLIEKSDYGIQAIATIVGFNSYSTFRRSFMTTYGITPQEYRIKKLSEHIKNINP